MRAVKLAVVGSDEVSASSGVIGNVGWIASTNVRHGYATPKACVEPASA